MKGKTLGGRYEIIEKVGGGGMAIVYKAKCTLLNRYVAVKVLRSEFTTDKDLVEKFKRESQAAASLSHPNIVNLYDVGEDDDIYYIVMEYIDGNTLKHLIKEKGPLDVDTTLDYASQIALGLQHAHDNHVIHRDIKPHNIMITKDDRAKVTDFGIAIAATSTTLTNVGSVIGSVHYFSPEQARGGYTDEKSDLYSLGIVMYEMATGRLPFEAENPLSVALKQIQEEPIRPREINENIPEGLENVILKLLQKEQSKRYQNIQSLMEDLKKLKDDVSLSFYNEEEELDSPTQVLPVVKDEDMKKAKKNNGKKKTKNKKPIIIGAIVAALLAALLFTYAIFNARDFFRAEDIEVPDFQDMHIDEAMELAEDLNITLNVDTQHDNEVEEDRIISQDPPAGMLVREAYPVTVVVSLGDRMLHVPNILYRNEIDGIILLEDAGFRRGEPTYAYSEFPEGSIIEQNPNPSTLAPAGSRVDYVISEGPEVISISMPHLVGLSIEEGTNALRELGIGIGSISRENSNEFEEGLITRQSIEPLTEITQGETVNIVVSRGPLQDEDNNDDNNNNNDNDNDDNNNDTDPNGDEEIEETSSQVTTTKRPLHIDLSDYNGNVSIDVKRLSTGGIVHSKQHNIQQTGNNLSLTIELASGLGSETFQVYVNGNKHGNIVELVF